MIFRKNKPPEDAPAGAGTLRGRESASPEPGASALARRFMAQDEPDTIDLGGSHGFPESASQEEPDTRNAGDSQHGQALSHEGEALITLDSRNAKFYVHPGRADSPVRLNGEAVTARTELRKGDRIRVGAVEFEFTEPVELL
ncbi:MAG: FHA domain-containing protein [Xanthomonadales bacterium]|jgi:hypothetical protein|nr:FHA domain-containing protein [Xanthomonadales bacterium]